MTQPYPPTSQPPDSEQAREFQSVVKSCPVPMEKTSSSETSRVYTVGISTASAIELWRARSEIRSTHIHVDNITGAKTDSSTRCTSTGITASAELVFATYTRFRRTSRRPRILAIPHDFVLVVEKRDGGESS